MRNGDRLRTIFDPDIDNDIGNPSGRTNSNSIEDMIGIPDAPNSSLFDILVTGYDSTGVLPNADGGLAERMEWIATNIATPTDVWSPEDPQSGDITLTNMNQWYSVFTAYTSTDYVIKGDITLDFPANQTYEVRMTRHDAAASSGAVATFIIGANTEARTFIVDPTEYLDIECRCTTAAGQVVDYYRAFEYAENSGIPAPT